MNNSGNNTPIQEWELRQGNALLGSLDRCSPGWPWTTCRFQAAPEFRAVQPLFAEELRLFDRDDFNPGKWKSAYQKIAELGLVLWPCGDAQPLTDFQLHIRDDEGWLRLSRMAQATG